MEARCSTRYTKRDERLQKAMVLSLSFYSTRREDRLQKGATKYPLSINGDISLNFEEGEIDGP